MSVSNNIVCTVYQSALQTSGVPERNNVATPVPRAFGSCRVTHSTSDEHRQLRHTTLRTRRNTEGRVGGESCETYSFPFIVGRLQTLQPKPRLQAPTRRERRVDRQHGRHGRRARTVAVHGSVKDPTKSGAASELPPQYRRWRRQHFGVRRASGRDGRRELRPTPAESARRPG
jgi:hypothetical protein